MSQFETIPTSLEHEDKGDFYDEVARILHESHPDGICLRWADNFTSADSARASIPGEVHRRLGRRARVMVRGRFVLVFLAGRP